MAIIAWFWLPNGPESAWFLTEEEQTFAVERIAKDNAMYMAHKPGSDDTRRQELTKRDVVETAKDWKTWYVLVFNICASVPSQAFSVFLPLVVQGLGYSSIEANLMTIPPYICGAVGLYIFALSSDHHKERGYHIIAGIAISLIGLIITVTVRTNGAKYVGLCILLLGSYIAPPLTVVWLSGNTPGTSSTNIINLNPQSHMSGLCFNVIV
jgi:hypothetical protein